MTQTRTRTRSKSKTPVKTQTKGGDLTPAEKPDFVPTRLPWDPRLENSFGDMGLTQANWRFICESLYPNATQPESVLMVWSYCKARNLDPFKKPGHIVPVFDAKQNKMVDTIWPGIAELRTTATRTGEYAGKDRVQFGPMITKTFSGTEFVFDRSGNKKGERKIEKTITFPEWASVTVYRMVQGVRCAFEGDPVTFIGTYARKSRFVDVPNEMWERRSAEQLAKCAEANSLRQAFPEEIGSDYTIEEMEGKIINEMSAAPAAPAEPDAPRTMRLTGPDPDPDNEDEKEGPGDGESGAPGGDDTPDAREKRPPRSGERTTGKQSKPKSAGAGSPPAATGDEDPDDQAAKDAAWLADLDTEINDTFPPDRPDAIKPHLKRLLAITEGDDPELAEKARALMIAGEQEPEE